MDHFSKPSCSCCSSEDHPHDHENANEQETKELWLLFFCTLFFFATMIEEDPIQQAWGVFGVHVLYAIPYLLCGIPIMKQACNLLFKGSVFNEFTLMCGATLAAIFLGQFAEAVGVMLFYRIGEYIQDKAAGSSRRSIKGLLASRSLVANVLEEDNEVATPVEEVSVGKIIIVRAGEKIPLDGTVESGNSDIDQSPLTGESLPIQVQKGNNVFGGSINLSGALTIRVDSVYADTHMARILDMVEHAATRKSPTERFISRFAKYYTPAVVALAFIVAVLPPLIITAATFSTWVYRALVLLVISCPCALLISIPLGYFGGIGAASRKGILIKGGNVIDDLMHITTVIFDKTGTLTKGRFIVSKIIPAQGIEEKHLLQAASIAESRASHPIARAIRAYAEKNELLPSNNPVSSDSETVLEFITTEIPGKGIEVIYGKNRYLAGTAALMIENTISPEPEDRPEAVVHIAENGIYLGHIFVEDEIKPDTQQAISSLHSIGFNTIMLSGDKEEAACLVAKRVGIETYRANLLPEGKVAAVEEIADHSKTAFVGDGINDAPILTISRVGIAMGEVGSEAAIEAADVVIVNDSLEKVVQLFGIAKDVRAIVLQNIAMALGIKLVIMGFGIAGLSGLWEAVFADVGVAVMAVLNSSRIIRKS